MADFIYSELKSYGLEVENHSWEKKGYSGKNIVATIPGEDDMEIILSAHYDSVSVSPGADDDGSGVSSLLMAAKILRGHSFKHTLKIVFFSGEEQGLYGSNRFAEEMYGEGRIILADLQLDGVGHAVSREGGKKMRLSASASSVWIANLVKNMAEKYRDEIGLDVLIYRDFAGSDHQSFINYGYEGVFFLEYEFNPHYHSPQDTIEHVNFSYLAKVCKLAIATAATIADEEINMMVRIVEPERGSIYFGDRKIFSLDDYQVIVLGKIKVRAEICYGEEADIMEFYMDGVLRGVDTNPPYEYIFGRIAIMKHHITVLAHGEKSEDMTEMDVYTFNLIPRYWLK
ncbi:MAG TPA: Zn-dependent exopeptidase M28 [Thermoplasmatales archaeon]|nr:Zn-dependent exopeptidase M28 [Thermoplasmatales archaeon]